MEILRGDLGRILYEATRDGTEYLFGEEITSLAEHADGVRVTFERAAPRTFDLVIGADGLHSAVRRLAFGAEDSLVSELGLYVSIFTVASSFGLTRAGQLYSVPGKTAAVFSAREAGQAVAQFFFCAPEISYDYRDTGQQQQILARAFAGVGWHVPELLRQLPAAPDFYFDSVSQVRLARWSAGRVALIGDAGYAAGPGGNGTGTAVVAAYVLAGELAVAGATTGPRSPVTSSGCAAMSPRARSRPAAAGTSWPRRPPGRSVSATGPSGCCPGCPPGE